MQVGALKSIQRINYTVITRNIEVNPYTNKRGDMQKTVSFSEAEISKALQTISAVFAIESRESPDYCSWYVTQRVRVLEGNSPVAWFFTCHLVWKRAGR